MVDAAAAWLIGRERSLPLPSRPTRSLLAQFVPRAPTPPTAVINQIRISDEITRKMGAAFDASADAACG